MSRVASSLVCTHVVCDEERDASKCNGLLNGSDANKLNSDVAFCFVFSSSLLFFAQIETTYYIGWWRAHFFRSMPHHLFVHSSILQCTTESNALTLPFYLQIWQQRIVTVKNIHNHVDDDNGNASPVFMCAEDTRSTINVEVRWRFSIRSRTAHMVQRNGLHSVWRRCWERKSIDFSVNGLLFFRLLPCLCEPLICSI